MEVRINTHGSNSLSTKAFFSEEKGFEVAFAPVALQSDRAFVRETAERISSSIG